MKPRASDLDFRAMSVMLAVALVAILGLGTFVVVQTYQEVLKLHGENVVRLNVAALAECDRVNALRSRVDANTDVIDLALKALVTHLKEDLNLGPLQERPARATSVKLLEKAITGLRIQPLTDCPVAIAHPNSYVPPSEAPVP